MENPDQFDGILMTVIQKSGGIQNYFDSVFGFISDNKLLKILSPVVL